MTTFERHRECGKPADVAVVGTGVLSELLTIRGFLNPSGPPCSRESLRLLFIELDRTLETVTVDECPFSGEVEVTAHGQMGPSVRLTWTCPTCGHDHEEDGE